MYALQSHRSNTVSIKLQYKPKEYEQDESKMRNFVSIDDDDCRVIGLAFLGAIEDY